MVFFLFSTGANFSLSLFPPEPEDVQAARVRPEQEGERVLGMDSCRRPASSKHVLALPDEAWIREIVRSIKEENPSYGVKRVWMAIRVHGWGVSQQVTDAASPRRGSSLFAFHHDRACVRG